MHGHSSLTVAEMNAVEFNLRGEGGVGAGVDLVGGWRGVVELSLVTGTRKLLKQAGNFVN
jgi:hypothetical protein